MSGIGAYVHAPQDILDKTVARLAAAGIAAEVFPGSSVAQLVQLLASVSLPHVKVMDMGGQAGTPGPGNPRRSQQLDVVVVAHSAAAGPQTARGLVFAIVQALDEHLDGNARWRYASDLPLDVLPDRCVYRIRFNVLDH